METPITITPEDVQSRSLEECLDEFFGPIGTPERDAFQKKVADDILRDNLRQERRKNALKRYKNIVNPLVNAIKNEPQVVRV